MYEFKEKIKKTYFAMKHNTNVYKKIYDAPH